MLLATGSSEQREKDLHRRLLNLWYGAKWHDMFEDPGQTLALASGEYAPERIRLCSFVSALRAHNAKRG